MRQCLHFLATLRIVSPQNGQGLTSGVSIECIGQQEAEFRSGEEALIVTKDLTNYGMRVRIDISSKSMEANRKNPFEHTDLPSSTKQVVESMSTL